MKYLQQLSAWLSEVLVCVRASVSVYIFEFYSKLSGARQQLMNVNKTDKSDGACASKEAEDDEDEGYAGTEKLNANGKL